MDVVDVSAVKKDEVALKKQRYERVLNVVDGHFSRERVSAENRGFVSGSYNSFYVDMPRGAGQRSSIIERNIEIELGNSNVTIDVKNEDYFQEAERFGRAYETRFPGERVTLRHNFGLPKI